MLFALPGEPLTYGVKGSLSAYSPGDKPQAWLCQQGSHLTTCLSLLIKSFTQPMLFVIRTAAATGGGRGLMLTVLSGPGMELPPSTPHRCSDCPATETAIALPEIIWALCPSPLPLSPHHPTVSQESLLPVARMPEIAQSCPIPHNVSRSAFK